MLSVLASTGAYLILAADDLDACQDERLRLIDSAGLSPGRVECRHLDMSSQRSVRRFAGALLADHPCITRLVVNPAGSLSQTFPGERRLTPDGIETQLACDYLSTYLLVRLMLPSLVSQRVSPLDSTDAAERSQTSIASLSFPPSPSTKGFARVVITFDSQAAASEASDSIKNSTMEREARSPEGESISSSRSLLPVENFNWETNYAPAKAKNRAQWFLRLFAE
ncbi:unnamed protein product [Protopolystoma xenopodis]|uniref:Uncharacterized protein n=1 Tax=Protopolystoma xenopodis TaxID=117903 RepID=A0A448WZU3_9PLAT|nr:unnamed protein product [Protopolystoma xenopodis]